MNISALLFIILAFWIFSLQSKVNNLEKLVNGLRDKKRYIPMDEEENTSTEKEIIPKEELPHHPVSLGTEELL